MGSLRAIAAAADGVQQRDATADACRVPMSFTTLAPRRERGDDAVTASPSARRYIGRVYMCTFSDLESSRRICIHVPRCDAFMMK